MRLRMDAGKFDALPFDRLAERRRRGIEPYDVDVEEGGGFVDEGEKLVPGDRVGAGGVDGEVDVGAFAVVAAGAGAEEDDAPDGGVPGEAFGEPVGDGAGAGVHGRECSGGSCGGAVQRMVKEPAATVTPAGCASFEASTVML
jgi:hypothetical protein